MQIMCHVGQTNLKRIQITPRIRIKIYGSHKMLYHVGFEPIVARLCCRETSKFTCVFEINFIGILFTAKIHSSAILSVNFTELMRLPEMYQHHHHQGQAYNILIVFWTLNEKVKGICHISINNLSNGSISLSWFERNEYIRITKFPWSTLYKLRSHILVIVYLLKMFSLTKA